MYVGVTTTVEVAIPEPMFEAVKEIFPVPDGIIPIFGVCVLVQLKVVVPVTLFVVKLTFTIPPSHKFWFIVALT